MIRFFFCYGLIISGNVLVKEAHVRDCLNLACYFRDMRLNAVLAPGSNAYSKGME